MEKHKIYFFKDRVYLAPFWLERTNDTNTASDDLTEARDLNNHDVSVNLSDYTVALGVDYLSDAEINEVKALITILEYAASICENRVTYEQIKLHPDLARSSFPDAEIFIVEE